jgi:hypothetical protein
MHDMMTTLERASLVAVREVLVMLPGDATCVMAVMGGGFAPKVKSIDG